MAMPYGGGARLDMEFRSFGASKPRIADLVRTVRHSESAPTVQAAT